MQDGGCQVTEEEEQMGDEAHDAESHESLVLPAQTEGPLATGRLLLRGRLLSGEHTPKSAEGSEGAEALQRLLSCFRRGLAQAR